MALVFPHIWIPSGGGQFEFVTWADGTDEQIKAMIVAADAGLINLSDYWLVGDERTVHLSAMDATGVGESHAEQDVTFVLMDTGENSGYKFADDTPVHFVVGMKDCLNETGYMNSTNTNVGSWEESARRAWCNNVFRAAVPVGLRSIFKQFKTITLEGPNSDALKTSLDYFALFAEKESVGRQSYSKATEAAALSQIEYYVTESNRIKQVNGSDADWWIRSPYGTSDYRFCKVRANRRSYPCDASDACGIAPFGCI